MEKISIKKLSDIEFEVTVYSQTSTIHRVTIEPSNYKKLTSGKISPEILIEKSFDFLLQRESNTSILRSFELNVIVHYFPDYERIIKSMIGNA